MTSTPRNERWPTGSINPSPTGVFMAVSHKHRQYILEYLVHRPGAVTFSDLAEYIAIKVGEPTPEGSESVLAGLIHIHLPHLAAAGLINYDVVRETVDLRVNSVDIQPFLQLTTASLRRIQDDRR